MGWHYVPKDNAWKQVTLASVHALGQGIWLRCNACGRSVDVAPLDFANEHGLGSDTALLTIQMRLRCKRCGERKGHCWPAPYNNLKQ